MAVFLRDRLCCTRLTLTASTTVLLLVLLLAPYSCSGALAHKNGEERQQDDSDDRSYGTEVSWPMQRKRTPFNLKNDYDATPQPFQRLFWRQWEAYQAHMEGCREAYPGDTCATNDAERVSMNAAQPALQRNFTAAGYAKVLAPSKSLAVLQEFWNEYHDNFLVPEAWNEGNVYTNHWKAPTQTLSVDAAAATAASGDGRRPGLSLASRRKLVQEVQAVLEQWCAVPLVPTSVYGIRVYTHGSVLAPHVDRYVYAQYERAGWLAFAGYCSLRCSYKH